MGGVRLYTQRINLFKYFLELPTLRWGINTKARGDIRAPGISAEKEVIGPDIRASMISWGVGAGMQGTLQNDLEVYAGVNYSQSFSRVVKKDGYFATLVDDGGTPGDPEDDEYETKRNDAKIKLAGLSIRIGMIF